MTNKISWILYYGIFLNQRLTTPFVIEMAHRFKNINITIDSNDFGRGAKEDKVYLRVVVQNDNQRHDSNEIQSMPNLSLLIGNSQQFHLRYEQ